MVQKNPYLVNNELPETNSIAYYDVESDQNLTAEEWNKLNFLSKEEIAISPDGRRVYISEKAYHKGIAMYGPGFWDDLSEITFLPVRMAGESAAKISIYPLENKQLTKFGAKIIITASAGIILGPGVIPAGAILWVGRILLKKIHLMKMLGRYSSL